MKDVFVTQAVHVLKKGGVVLFPTETAYGLAADATNIKAVKRIFDIKGREETQTPPLIVADFHMASTYVEWTPLLRQLARTHWPGPLTISIKGKKKNSLAKNVIRDDGTIGIRVSSHPVAQKLSAGLGKPIVATSANIHGQPNCYSVKAAMRQFLLKGLLPDAFIDVGIIPKRLPSTIVAEQNGKIFLLRKGSMRIKKSFFG